MQTIYRQIKNLYNRYERVLMPGTLALGVVVDSITFANINIISSLCLLAVYLVIAGLAIVFYNANLKDRRFLKYFSLLAPLTIQFTFGALLSASFIFYIFSGTLFVSWPFIGLIAVLMISNDALRHHYLRPIVHLGVYFFILFSTFSIVLPFVLKTMSAGLFIFSGILSLVLMAGYVWLLGKAVPLIKNKFRSLAIVVICIFAILNTLYFSNIIPPIPLSLKDLTIAHDLQRSGSNYILTAEKQPFWQLGQTFHKNNEIFIYTAIFAPNDLNTSITHDWQYYDPVKKDWIPRDRLAFNIAGGAKQGYRGFSVKSNLALGKWRVYVENQRGQVLGRVKFTVLPAVESLDLEEVVK